jgi:hypothetical protein
LFQPTDSCGRNTTADPREMSIANPLWGAPRIHGELLKLGIEIGQTSVAKYMVRRRHPPSQGWRTFIRNHADGIVAMDMFVVPTISFRLLYGLHSLSPNLRRTPPPIRPELIYDRHRGVSFGAGLTRDGARSFCAGHSSLCRLDSIAILCRHSWVLVSNTFAPNWSVGVEVDHRHSHRQSNRTGRCPSKASAIRRYSLVRLN